MSHSSIPKALTESAELTVGNYALVSIANNPKYPFPITGAWPEDKQIQIQLPCGTFTYVPYFQWRS